jgi:hypothetical protein
MTALSSTERCLVVTVAARSLHFLGASFQSDKVLLLDPCEWCFNRTNSRHSYSTLPFISLMGAPE